MVAAIQASLLTMVQGILSDMNADNVNSIDDTTEADQVAQIIVDTYYDLISMRRIPEHFELSQLVALADNTRPTHLKLPDDAVRLKNDYFYYNVSTDGTPSFAKVVWCDPEVFLARAHNNNPDNSDVLAVTDTSSGTPIYVKTSKHPTYFTSFDDVHLVCNSYNSVVDSTLQASKTQAFISSTPAFTKLNTSIPDIDPEYFPYLKAEARARCFAWLDKQVDSKAEQTARRNKINVQNKLLRIGTEDRRPDYGRK